MTAQMRAQFDKVFRELEKSGLLLVSDQFFPSVAFTIAQTKRKGSWWSFPEAHTIFAINEMLEDHPDVLIMKLISGKVTFVHRELWSRIYSIGVAREGWQTRALSAGAKLLLKKIDAEGSVQTGLLGKAFDPKPGVAARELEFYMLIHSKQIHTESGTHAKILETWDVWAKSASFRGRPKNPFAARRFLEIRLASIESEYGGTGSFPWPPNV
jgi:hypothetical protein